MARLYNQSRLHAWSDDVPPIEYETAYYAANTTLPATAEERHPALH